MLTKRIIPCLDVDNGRVVKGVSFLDLRDAGDPVELASFYDDQGAAALFCNGWWVCRWTRREASRRRKTRRR